MEYQELAPYASTVISAVRGYTNRPFISRTIFIGEFEITSDKLDRSLAPLRDGDIVEIFGSEYNDGLYMLKSDTEFYSQMRDQKFKGKIAWINAPIDKELFGQFASYSKSMGTKNTLRTEQLDAYSYTLNNAGNDMNQGFPIGMLSAFNHLRQLPHMYEKDLARVGLI